jgi:integrase
LNRGVAHNGPSIDGFSEERLGHSSITITGDLYTHVRHQVDQDAADRTASFILGAG